MRPNANGPSTNDADALGEALAALAALLGEKNLATDAPALRRAETATFATQPRIAAIARPADRAQVQACVRLANAYRRPLYPISRGKNWGYGSRVPTADGAILLSLERLDEIVAYDEALAYVAVQPGVTFRQLAAFLNAQGSALGVSAPGSTPEASVVGNTVERGIVQGPHPDRSRHVCALEVVLPTGECVQTGMAALPHSRAARVHPWGLGPALDGLFLQSNLGIVTEMTVWLRPRPAYHQHVAFRLADADGLAPLVEALRQLRMEETLTTSIGLHNADKVLSLQEQYPFAEARGQTPLPEAVRRQRLAALGGAWFGEAALQAATPTILAGLRARVDAVLAPHVADLHLSEVNAPGPIFGEAVGHSLAQAYWRKPTPPPPAPDPDRDRCGVLWQAPVVPFEAGALGRCARLAERLLPAHGFEPLLSFQAVSARCVYAVVSILYDRDVPGEDDRALACYHALSAAFGEEGFPPYRLALPGLAQPPAQEASYRALLHTLKRTLDPNHILAPGRYDFGAPPPHEATPS